MQRELQDFGLEVIPQSDFGFCEAIEDGLSFVENAIKKARHACLHTNLPAIADDSGIEVDALNGAPGIHSARFADGRGDQANNEKLLNELADETNRAARFQCVIVYMEHSEDPTPIICQGTWEGRIATQAAGENGFGYDSLFVVPELNLHSAQLDPSQKKQLSHRAQALAKLKHSLAS